MLYVLFIKRILIVRFPGLHCLNNITAQAGKCKEKVTRMEPGAWSREQEAENRE